MPNGGRLNVISWEASTKSFFNPLGAGSVRKSRRQPVLDQIRGLRRATLFYRTKTTFQSLISGLPPTGTSHQQNIGVKTRELECMDAGEKVCEGSKKVRGTHRLASSSMRYIDPETLVPRATPTIAGQFLALGLAVVMVMSPATNK